MFKPAGIPSSELVKVFLMLDELEALRLCDSLGMSQAEAGTQMGISRGTVQRLVNSGRQKLVSAVIHCQALVIVEEENNFEDLYIGDTIPISAKEKRAFVIMSAAGED